MMLLLVGLPVMNAPAPVGRPFPEISAQALVSKSAPAAMPGTRKLATFATYAPLAQNPMPDLLLAPLATQGTNPLLLHLPNAHSAR